MLFERHINNQNLIEKSSWSLSWWLRPLIQVLGRLKQVNHVFKANLKHKVSGYFLKKKKNYLLKVNCFSHLK